MKVTRTEIQKIYQEQVKKTQGEKSGEAFKKVMKETAATGGPAKPVLHPPSGVTGTNPIFTGKPVPQADPVDTMKFAAEVVASEPDIRQEKIDRIKSLIASGQYNVPAEQVAERMLHSKHLTESWEG